MKILSYMTIYAAITRVEDAAASRFLMSLINLARTNITSDKKITLWKPLSSIIEQLRGLDERFQVLH